MMEETLLFRVGKPTFILTIMPSDDLEQLRWDLGASHPMAIIRFVRGKQSQTHDAFFAEVSAAFQFPLYFGNNWDAFHDCLTDLEWMRAAAYLMFIPDAHLLLSAESAHDFAVLIKHLDLANDAWQRPMAHWPPERDRQPTSFHVIFQCPPEQLHPFQQRLHILGIEYAL